MHRKEEHAKQERLEEVKTTWDTLKASSSAKESPKAAIPNPNEFRKLSVVKIYEKPGVGENRSLRDPFVAPLLVWRRGSQRHHFGQQSWLRH